MRAPCFDCGAPTSCDCGFCPECCEVDACPLAQLTLETFDADELGLDPEEPWDA